MKYTYRVTLKDREEKEIIVYVFNYLELVTLISKINPDYYNIKVEEQDNVMDVKSFLDNAEHLLTHEFWIEIKKELDNNPFELN